MEVEPPTIAQEDALLEPSQYESTADFNKEIKELRQELIAEGKVDPVTGQAFTERESMLEIQVKIPER